MRHVGIGTYPERATPYHRRPIVATIRDRLFPHCGHRTYLVGLTRVDTTSMLIWGPHGSHLLPYPIIWRPTHQVGAGTPFNDRRSY
jgi:hypothetical protein